ncbi:forkhead box protein B2-like [Orbicella faveolata]|uniref:forkhead box protein B2-like n=1 Tax=Orbicella faveolata TaxID=48498 RepID=UPI0009E324AD|nr:forkhead box protein B2-like [Orbicella faveolata]
MIIMRVTPLFFFLQKKCMGKCKKATMPGELVEEENDPHHRQHHPSLPPNAKKCIHECHEEHKLSKPPPPPKEPGRVADEENDPRRPRPSSGPHMPSNMPPTEDVRSSPSHPHPSPSRPRSSYFFA